MKSHICMPKLVKVKITNTTSWYVLLLFIFTVSQVCKTYGVTLILLTTVVHILITALVSKHLLWLKYLTKRQGCEWVGSTGVHVQKAGLFVAIVDKTDTSVTHSSTVKSIKVTNSAQREAPEPMNVSLVKISSCLGLHWNRTKRYRS